MNPNHTAEHVEGCRESHARLVEHLTELLGSGALDDSAVRGPSRLPDWSVGHVLAHLSRNADSHTRVIEAALRGETVDQYEGGVASRNADIERDATRAADVQVADVSASIVRLERAWHAAATADWSGSWRNPFFGERPLRELPFRRWREVEVHHVDLGLTGFDIDDWSKRYLNEELSVRTMEWASRQPIGLTTLPAAALRLRPQERLAWLLGRAQPEGLDPVSFG